MSLVGLPRRRLGQGWLWEAAEVDSWWDEACRSVVAPLESFPPDGRGSACPRDGTMAGDVPG